MCTSLVLIWLGAERCGERVNMLVTIWLGAERCGEHVDIVSSDMARSEAVWRECVCIARVDTTGRRAGVWASLVLM